MYLSECKPDTKDGSAAGRGPSKAPSYSWGDVAVSEEQETTTSTSGGHRSLRRQSHPTWEGGGDLFRPESRSPSLKPGGVDHRYDWGTLADQSPRLRCLRLTRHRSPPQRVGPGSPEVLGPTTRYDPCPPTPASSVHRVRIHSSHSLRYPSPHPGSSVRSLGSRGTTRHHTEVLESRGPQVSPVRTFVVDPIRSTVTRHPTLITNPLPLGVWGHPQGLNWVRPLFTRGVPLSTRTPPTHP